MHELNMPASYLICMSGFSGTLTNTSLQPQGRIVPNNIVIELITVYYIKNAGNCNIFILTL